MINSNQKFNNTIAHKLPERIVYDLLYDVFISGGYSSIVLDQTLRLVEISKRPYITRLFYGVLEKSIQFDYILSKVSDKKPKKPILIILKIGLYLLRYTNTPIYAAIDKTVNLTKSIGKSALSGYVNAVLRKSVDVLLPGDNLSVNLSYPDWLIERLKNRYDDDFIKKILGQNNTLTHVRPNKKKITIEDFEKKLCKFNKSELGYFLDQSQIYSLNDKEYIIQSFSSMMAVHAYASDIGQSDKLSVLDLCAAPGGKAIYLKELCPSLSIVACDIHPHRLELIKKYASNMHTELSCVLNDATAYNKEWEEKFDLVICDVPCSGFGVKSKPDILINRKQEDINQLIALQKSIIKTASKYVKKGGVLCYSTCTILQEENEEIVEWFIKNNKSFMLNPIKNSVCKNEKSISIEFEENNGMINLYSYKYNSDGFFIAKLIKNRD